MVILEKRNPVSLVKKGASFDNVSINLNWTQEVNEGFFKKLFSDNAPVDLDLGCFVKFKDSRKDAVQPLGNKFGSLNAMPFVRHSGDDRSGAVSEGETLTLNGTHWDEIERMLVYCYIYEGAPSWNKTNAKVRIEVPGNDPILVEMGKQSSSKRTCALVQFLNDDGKIKVTKEMNFFVGQSDMDTQYGYGFKWTTGRK